MNKSSSPQSTKKEALAKMSGLSGNDASNNCLPKDFLEPTGEGECKISTVDKLTTKNSIDEVFVTARQMDASDVHISVGNPVTFRKFSHLLLQSNEAYTPEDTKALIEKFLSADQLGELMLKGDLEFVYTIEGAGRFRITVLKQRHGLDLTARLIPMSVRSFEESGMPESCKGLTKWAQGLVLVTGPAGCGKSSSLATLVDMINQERDDHIITIENPIELPYKPAKCQITQREVNKHTLSQANALRAALREDPDILVVSELRDLESIQLAVSAAETGHLVFGTMNTNNAAQTISSLIDSFPPDDRPIITSMISESLRGVISQQLIPQKDGSGVVPAYEVLILNSATANMIREGKVNQLNNAMSTGKAAGMVLLDHSLQKLVNEGAIEGVEAYNRAINQGHFQQFAPKDEGSTPEATI